MKVLELFFFFKGADEKDTVPLWEEEFEIFANLIFLDGFFRASSCFI